MCQDGSVNLPSQEVDAIIRNLSRKEKKISKLWWALGFAAIFSVALFALTFASALSANEASKESHVNSQHLEDLDGNVVATAELRSYGTLFDLPRFEISTLQEVKSLTVSFHGGAQMSFRISNVLKCPGGKLATFIAMDGSKVVVDSESFLVKAYVGEETYFVDMSEEAVVGTRALSEAATPRLYSKEEFFLAENGFAKDGSRTLANDNTMGGFAALTLAISEEIVDDYELQGIEADTLFFSGSVLEEDGQEFAFASFMNADGKIKTEITKDTTSTVYDYTRVDRGMEFAFEDEELQECIMNPENTADMVAAKADEVVVGLMNSCGARLFATHSPETNKVTIFEIEHIDVNTDGDEIYLPTIDDCMALQEGITNGTISTEAGSRRLRAMAEPQVEEKAVEDENKGRGLWWSPPPPPPPPPCYSCHNTNKFYKDLYALKAENCPGSWWCLGLCNRPQHCTVTGPSGDKYDITRCESGNSYGTTSRRHNDGRIIAAIEGTSPTDCADWHDNTNGNNQGGFRQGFWNNQNRIQSCLRSRGTPHTVAGHSLGGAAATIFKQIYAPGAELVTFGAPRTHYGASGSCSTGGTRIFHADDPIASSGIPAGASAWRHSGQFLNMVVGGLCGTPNLDMSQARHAVTSSKRLHGSCDSLMGWYGCSSSSISVQNVGCTTSTHAGNDALWHFASTHVSYKRMLERNPF